MKSKLGKHLVAAYMVSHASIALAQDSSIESIDSQVADMSSYIMTRTPSEIDRREGEDNRAFYQNLARIGLKPEFYTEFGLPLDVNEIAYRGGDNRTVTTVRLTRFKSTDGTDTTFGIDLKFKLPSQIIPNNRTPVTIECEYMGLPGDVDISPFRFGGPALEANMLSSKVAWDGKSHFVPQEKLDAQCTKAITFANDRLGF